jgi:hypothetical protein
MPLSTPGALRVDPLLNRFGNARKVDYFRKKITSSSHGGTAVSASFTFKRGCQARGHLQARQRGGDADRLEAGELLGKTAPA